MTYICRYLNLKHIKFTLTNSKIVAITLASLLLALSSSQANSYALVTQVKGKITITAPGLTKNNPITPGMILSERVQLKFSDKNTHIWLLCPTQDKPIMVNEAEYKKPLCPSMESQKMRGGEEDSIPFVLLPNQSALSEITRVLWSGPKNAEYLIMLFQYDELGSEVLFKEWTTEKRKYSESGFHELPIDPPFQLQFQDGKNLTYKLEVENIDTSQTSANFDEIFINPITRSFPLDLLKQGEAIIENQGIDLNSQLGQLILAFYLESKGQLAEAFEVAAKLTNSSHKISAKIIMANALYLPGIPEDIIVNEFGKLLEAGASDENIADALIACEGLQSPSNNLLSKKARAYRKNLVEDPKYSPFCSPSYN